LNAGWTSGGENVDKRKQTNHQGVENEARLAPGMNGVAGLDAKATPEDIAEGNATKVTKLEYDEYDSSPS
jgi:hypothetical protein